MGKAPLLQKMPPVRLFLSFAVPLLHEAERPASGAAGSGSTADAVRRRLHAFVRLGCCALLQGTLWDYQAASVEAVGSRLVFDVRVLTDGILGPANLLSEQNPP